MRSRCTSSGLRLRNRFRCHRVVIAQERNDVEVYLVDNSSDALKVASANLAGLGNHAVKVKVFESNWLDQLPDELKIRFSL